MRAAYEAAYLVALTKQVKCVQRIITVKLLSIGHSVMDFVLPSNPDIVILKVGVPLGDKIGSSSSSH